jgi:DNA-binding FadR family transcriptional regulator
LFESETAALAARNITDEAIEKLAGLVERMRTDDLVAADEADEAFHRTIAEASNNAAMIHTVESLWRMRQEIDTVKATYQAVCVHDAYSRAAEHEAIFLALRDRDPDGARTAMRKHFQRLIETMLDETERLALEEVQQQASKSRERFAATAKIG